jgi:hypothetical protein
MSGAMVARGDHWHAVGMMTFQHDHLARRGRPHRHMDAVGQFSGVDSAAEPRPAQMQENVLTPHTVYRKGKPRR